MGSRRSVRGGLAVTVVLVAVTRAVADHPLACAWFVGALGVVAAAMAGWRAYRAERRFGGWHLLGTALLCLAVRAVLRAARPVVPGARLTPVDGLTGVAVVCAALGLAMLLRSRIGSRVTDVVFEAVMGAAATGVVAWALAVDRGGIHGSTLILLGLPMLDVALLWLSIRLVWLTTTHPVGYRYLVASFVCLLSVDVMKYGTALSVAPARTAPVSSLALWALCLWAAAAVHPSLLKGFEPVADRPSRLGPAHVACLGGLVLVGPTVFLAESLEGTTFDVPSLLVVLTGLPLLVAVYLMRQVQNRAAAEYRAQHDPLTGLPNRVLFHDRLDVALTQAQRSRNRVAVMFLDLDRFKSINDSLGHEVGNQVLRGVANRLRSSVRAGDTVARLGGDEFTVLLTDVADGATVESLAKTVLRAFGEPFVAGKTELITSTSVGIALFPDDGDAAATLLKNADTAMYRAKASGRNTYQFYTSDMSARAEVKLSLESSLRKAINRHELVMHYQPKVDLLTREVVGLEALIRWPHSDLGFVSPAAFIPLAEETGLIFGLGEFALEEACRQTQAWAGQGLATVPVAVNLSARQFAQNRVESTVECILRSTGLPPELLELEITESVFLEDLGAASRTLGRLRDIGVRCSIDDFGTGYSGLSYLAQMPIDSLKIDRSFVAEISEFSMEAPIVEAIVALAHSLRLNVIAEGVETPSQARFLSALGCEQMQGYLFSPALAPDELERFLIIHAATPSLAGDLFDESRRPTLIPSISGVPARTEISDLLVAVCCDNHGSSFDPRTVEEALMALRSLEPSVTSPPSAFRSASLRLAVGTFAGLVPISSGLAAAGALPTPTQSFAARVFAEVGVIVPPPDQPSAVPSGDRPAAPRPRRALDGQIAAGPTGPARPGPALPTAGRAQRGARPLAPAPAPAPDSPRSDLPTRAPYVPAPAVTPDPPRPAVVPPSPSVDRPPVVPAGGGNLGGQPGRPVTPPSQGPVPSQPGSTPAHGATPPGQVQAPGQPATPPTPTNPQGQGGAPGHGNPPPGQNIPPTTSNPPGPSTPPQGGAAPGSSPAQPGPTPSQGATPPGQTTAPGQTTPPGQAAPPAQTPPPGQTTAPGQTTPPGQVTAPGHTPPGQAAPPGQTPPPGQTTAPGQTTPPGQVTAPGQTTPPGQITAPGQGTAPGQTTPPGQKATPGRSKAAPSHWGHP